MYYSFIPLNLLFSSLILFFFNYINYVWPISTFTLQYIPFLNSYSTRYILSNVFKQGDNRLISSFQQHSIECLTHIIIKSLTFYYIIEECNAPAFIGLILYKSSMSLCPPKFKCSLNDFASQCGQTQQHSKNWSCSSFPGCFFTIQHICTQHISCAQLKVKVSLLHE